MYSVLIGKLAESVKDLGTELQRVDTLRKEVIANVSHELRSPLALIGGYAEMVSDILDYSQLQSGFEQLKKEWYNLYEIAESEVIHCEQNAAKHQIKVQLSASMKDIPVYVDALKLSRVLRNLLYNAVNHTKDQDTIVVEIKKEKTFIKVEVKNPGEPIPEAERELIWERYQRSQHKGGRHEGTGLGLSIVSTILSAHEMTYGVDCENGITIFWFACPLSE